jgi:hypothetical protein
VTWVVDCVHRLEPPPVGRGRRDGSESHRWFCGDCDTPLR